MDFLISAILGLLQGLTEFLPVSSSGHLVVLERLIGFQIPVLTFHVFLHVGTALAVIAGMRRDFSDAAGGFRSIGADLAGRISAAAGKGGSEVHGQVHKSSQRKLAYLILAAAVPMAAAGALLTGAAAAVSASALLTGAGFLVSGILLLVTDMVKPGSDTVRDMTMPLAAAVGAAWGISVLPGISGLAFSVSICIFAGMSRKSAIRFSYLVFVPSVAAALIKCLADGIGNGVFTGRTVLCCLIGTAASALSARAVFNTFLALLKKRKLSSFAYYCFVIGIFAVLVSYIT